MPPQLRRPRRPTKAQQLAALCGAWAGLLDGLRDACRGGRPVPEAAMTRVDAERERLGRATRAAMKGG